MAAVRRRRQQRHTVALKWLAHPALLFERALGPGLPSLVMQAEVRNSSSANDFAQSVRGAPYEVELSGVGLVNVISPKWRAERTSCSRTCRKRAACSTLLTQGSANMRSLEWMFPSDTLELRAIQGCLAIAAAGFKRN